MENMNLDGMVVCPYDKSHLIRKERMQIHLFRCSRNNPHVIKVTCPFNGTHVLDPPELELHVTICPERRNFEHFVNFYAPVTSPIIPPPMPEVPSEENWNDEPDVPSYNPQLHATNAGVVRTLNGGTPLERKELSKKERERILTNAMQKKRKAYLIALRQKHNLLLQEKLKEEEE